MGAKREYAEQSARKVASTTEGVSLVRRSFLICCHSQVDQYGQDWEAKSLKWWEIENAVKCTV